MATALTSRGPADDVPLAAADLFSAQEEAFLFHYSESLSRLQAMIAAGYVPQRPDMATQQALVQKAGELLAKAERLSLSAIASAVGGDKVATMARLWAVCKSDALHEAIKGLQIMCRVHGLWEKQASNTQVALVFTQAQAPAHLEKPVGLPFTLPSGDYSAFSEPDLENEEGKKA